MLTYFAILTWLQHLPNWDLLLTDANIATMRIGGKAYGVVENAALAITAGRISWVGPMSELPPVNANESRSIQGRWLTPALIDCHTHLMFAGDRAVEYEERLDGVSYEEISRRGGGISSTVRATRLADKEMLINSARLRLNALVQEGVATIEIKSGYGLNLEAELAMLEAARTLGEDHDVEIITTFLGAHSVPTEFDGRSDDYIDYLISEVLPIVHHKKLADAVDAYCEKIAFSTKQIAKFFENAVSLGIPVKLHADQFSDSGGAKLAAAFHALSADHLEYTSENGVRALADSSTVAVLLPGAFLTLSETQKPPVRELRDYGVPIAIATDCNPGTSPLCSLRFAMNLATILFRLTPEECLAGVTRNAAQALGLKDDRGTIDEGMRADIAEWDINHPRELTYWIGLNQLNKLFINGKEISTLRFAN
jgi:imidazolonepropionase